MKYPSMKTIALVIATTAIVPLITGCPASDESAAVTVLQSALSDLTQNRSLVEQFVRDVKASVPPTDPNYQQALDSYEDARDAYNHYLDTVENPSGEPSSRSVQSVKAITAARNTTAEFLADATTALKPSVSTRRLQFQRAVVIPNDLQQSLGKLPKSAREALINQLDDQVRWRSWGQF